MANVSEKHPQFSAAEAAWTLCRDTASGARQVKDKGTVYLPKPQGMDRGDYSGSYLPRAAFFPAVGRTIQALAGTVFTRPPLVRAVPETIVPDLANLTFKDEAVADVAVCLVTEVLTTGRAGILLDMPIDGGRPYWCLLPAEKIVNWRTARVGNDPDALVQVILREDVDVPTADGFGRKIVPQYRELALIEGVYQVRVWSASSPALVKSIAATPWTAGEWIRPVRRGVTLDFIPFTFIGPNGITADVVKPPLEDLADVVIAHYRNSADHEYGLFLTALPTPWVSGLAGTNQTLKIGPSTCWKLEKDGRAGLLEFSGEGLGAIREAMQSKEKMMGVLGGRLLLETPHGGQAAETATSARLRYAAETASLRTIAGAVSAALTRVLRWHVWWLTNGDVPLDVRVDLADEFFQLKATADEIKATLILYQSDSISFETFFDLLQKGGWTREGVTAAQELEEIRRTATHFARA